MADDVRVRSNVSIENSDFTLFSADLEHLDNAVEAFRKRGQFTASERVAYVRTVIEAYLTDNDPR